MKCQICDKGEVIEKEEKNHKTMVLGQELTIPEAIVGRCDTCGAVNYAFRKETREVKPAKLPRFPRFATCPKCGKGGEGDTTVCSYVDSGMPEDSPRFIGCGYCSYDGPAPDHPLYPRDGRNN